MLFETLSTHFTKLLLAILILFLGSKLKKSLSDRASYARLAKVAADRRKQRDSALEEDLALLKDLPDEATQNLIVNSTVTKLNQLLNSDKLTSEQLVKTFFHRSATIGLDFCFITESNFKEALELAKACDATRKKTKPEDRPKLGRLYGIPVSIKDSYFQKGFDTTCGCAHACFKPSPEDSEVIKLLKARGAIPFIRSSTPQGLQVFDCESAMWGLARNPWDETRTVSGSSGGEGGLVAAKCSPIGLGSDLRGSIRIPAAFCGIAGFKPTRGRLLDKGHVTFRSYATSKFSILQLAHGPMARCVDDLAIFTEALISEEIRKINPAVYYLPWNESKYQAKGKMRIGYCVTEKFYGATKSVQRAVREAAAALKSQGHEVEEIKIPNFDRMSLLMILIMTSEGMGLELLKKIGGEKPLKPAQTELAIRTMPTIAKKALRLALKLAGKSRLEAIMRELEEMPTHEFHDRMHEFYTVRDEMLNFFVKNKFDAILSPAMPCPAFKQGHGIDFALVPCYTWPANYSNLAAGVVPVTYVKEGEEVYDMEDCFYDDFISTACRESMKGSKGMPVTVQVMTLPWEDEKCLAVMKMIESKVNFKDLPPIKSKK